MEEYQYSFTQVSGGYRWNMLQRIYYAIGIEPIGSGDADGKTILTFSRALTDAEFTIVAAVMADNPTFPPNNPGTTYIIRDVWNQKAYFETALGFPYKIFYSESVVGSGNVDQIELHFATLNNSQKNKVATEYGKLITIKN